MVPAIRSIVAGLGQQLDQAGYQLGVLVVRELLKKYSIQMLAHWSEAEAKPQVRAALERISKMKTL